MVSKKQTKDGIQIIFQPSKVIDGTIGLVKKREQCDWEDYKKRCK